MTSAERLRAMLTLIEEKEYCTVSFLAQAFGVSHMTVRRDLSILVAKNKILRCQGGAGAINFNETTTPAFIIRELHNVENKKVIALKASAVLNPGSVIYIDHSSTVIQLLKYITPESGITVVTNGIRAFAELSEKKIKLYCTGGEFYSLEQAYFGKSALKTINMFHFDAAFLSPRGIIPQEGAFDSTEHECAVLQAAINNADKSYVLTTTNKIGDRFRYKICDISQFTEVFTDTDINKNTLL